ncbi:SGNH/GDSL hydrolase family protein [Bradyrhizobium guangdongense]|uniref:SGNH/GDSL hydrolase family protein n=1 Tax=Bradyrhizobium guangdongense TaxID=1325090 RepID=UPI001319D46B|nr:SGNH/GDSL hydrolase family protein [Bradyrhizobium guangdongense]
MPELFASYPRAISGLRKAGAIGDSLTADAVGNGWTNWGWLAWARRYLNDRLDISTANVFAVGGATVSDVRTLQLPQALAANLDICFVMCGQNSLDGDPASTAAIWADLQAIYDELLQHGAFVPAILMRVHGSAAPQSADVVFQASALNRLIIEYARSRSSMLVIDLNPLYLDFATGQAISDFLRDGIHDNQPSAKAGGRVIADGVSAAIPAFDDRFSVLGDTYDAVKNPRGNLLANGLLSGTGGGVANGASGTVAASWSLQRNANSGASAAGSKQAVAGYTNLEAQRITIGGTSDGTGLVLASEDLITNVSEGDVLQAEMQASWNLSTADIIGIGLNLVYYNAGFGIVTQTWDGYFSPSNGALPSGSDSVIFKTEPLAVPSGVSHIFLAGAVQAPASGSPSGTIDFSRASVRKVI